MTPLEIYFQHFISTCYDAIPLFYALVITAIFAGLFMLKPKFDCMFGLHSYRLVEAKNDNGIWTAKRKCVRCGSEITEITDTAHFRVGRT